MPLNSRIDQYQLWLHNSDAEYGTTFAFQSQITPVGFAYTLLHMRLRLRLNDMLFVYTPQSYVWDHIVLPATRHK